uniref:atherin-like n=1 Tax=Nyctereutes procyonoides TaxID=34880 RepID=UPI002444F48A|nr:atherin-like [Nyctereutes procyonoides]
MPPFRRLTQSHGRVLRIKYELLVYGRRTWGGPATTGTAARASLHPRRPGPVRPGPPPPPPPCPRPPPALGGAVRRPEKPAASPEHETPYATRQAAGGPRDDRGGPRDPGDPGPARKDPPRPRGGRSAHPSPRPRPRPSPAPSAGRCPAAELRRRETDARPLTGPRAGPRRPPPPRAHRPSAPPPPPHRRRRRRVPSQLAPRWPAAAAAATSGDDLTRNAPLLAPASPRDPGALRARGKLLLPLRPRVTSGPNLQKGRR